MEIKSVNIIDMGLLEKTKFKCSVSSVLNRDVKQHGKQFMFDAEEDTAWSSNDGKPQWVSILFEEPQDINGYSFQFQGGFVGKHANVVIETPEGRIVCDEQFYPEDVNSIQNFNLKAPVTGKKVKFIFGASTDFFGRIIVYKMKLY